jgi:protein required for attachment to host cells
MTVRVVVADEREASFFDIGNRRTPLAARGAVVNEAARLRDRDLETDRPGRGFNPSSQGRHAVDGERSTRRHGIETFARMVAQEVYLARSRHEFERLVIVAGPRMLGLLRGALPANCRELVAAEISKDLAHHDLDVIREAVSRSAFSPSV